jgi:hypothetical protein
MDLHHLPRHLPKLFLDPVPLVKIDTTREREIPLTRARSLVAHANTDADPRVLDTGTPAQELQI